MCLKIIRRIVESIIGSVRCILLFENIKQHMLPRMVTEQKMPKHLGKEKNWSKVRKNKRREIFNQIISTRCIVPWIHKESVP